MNNLIIENQHFVLLGGQKIIKGINRSMIFDTHNQKFIIIPNDFLDILVIKNKTIKSILSEFDSESSTYVLNFFTMLHEKHIIYLTKFKNELDFFIPLEEKWDSPDLISNIIVDFNTINTQEIDLRLNQILDLKIPHVQIRIFQNYAFTEIEYLLMKIYDSHIKSIEFILPYNDEINMERLQKIIAYHLRINSILFYNCKNESFESFMGGETKISFIKNTIINEKSCGCINVSYFSLSKNTFMESQFHNTCLNRKVSIDCNGDIKNCPSMSENYGNIKDTTLDLAVNSTSFKKTWNIKKDDVSVCKDCEFRHICTDCRAYTEDPNDLYSKPLKCGYSPYTNEWSEWSTNPLKQKAIEFYGMQDLIKK